MQRCRAYCKRRPRTSGCLDMRLRIYRFPDGKALRFAQEMKLRVHDDIGHNILAARRVLLQHADRKEIRANAALWEQSISVLYRSSQITAQSEPLEAAKKRAEELGVRVLLTGDEPQTQRIRALNVLAICECAANCVRHADGTELYVRFWRKPGCTEVALTNNGAAPKEKNHGGRRPFHAASTHKRSRRQNGGSEHPPL